MIALPAARAAPPPTPSGALVGVRAAALSLFVALACFAVSIPLSDFHLGPTLMGIEYAAMSLDPLGGVGPFPERFLTPLLARLVWLHGDRIGLFSHAMLVVLLALVHHGTLRRSRDHVWSVAFTLGIAVCGTVEVYRGLVGYSDPTTYAILCAAALWARHTWVFWPLMALGLMNHGSTVFLWPWLVYQRWCTARLGWRDAALAVVAVGLYAVARENLMAAKDTEAFSLTWYLAGIDWVRATELWLLLLPNTVFCFGFLLLVSMWDLVGAGRREACVDHALMLAAVGAILLLALDIFRFVGLLAFPMMTAMQRRLVPDRRHRWMLVAAVVLTVASLPWQRQWILYLLERLTEFQLAGILHPTWNGLFPACWPAFVGYAAFLVALLVVALRTRPVRAPSQ